MSDKTNIDRSATSFTPQDPMWDNVDEKDDTEQIIKTESEIRAQYDAPDPPISYQRDTKWMTFFITIPQTNIVYRALHDKMTGWGQPTYVLTKCEWHKDGGYHIHLVMKLKQGAMLMTVINLINELKRPNYWYSRGTIDYQFCKDIGRCIQYVKKDRTSIVEFPFLEWGDEPRGRGRRRDDDGDSDEWFEAIKEARDGNLHECMDQILKLDPKFYIGQKATIREHMKSENQVRPKRDLPNMDRAHVKLNKYQQQIWDLMEREPKPRQIFWFWGPPKGGKSFMFQYLKLHHLYGLFDAGECASGDKLNHRYDEEGIIAWDIPLTFDYETLGNQLCHVIEKYSNFGNTVVSNKYKGSESYVRGHCVVFANRPPMDQLRLKTIIEVHIPYEPTLVLPDLTPFDRAISGLMAHHITNHRYPVDTDGFNSSR